MNLLVISDIDKKYHYFYIRNLNRLLSPGSKKGGNKIFDKCLKRFSSKKAFESENHKCNYENNIGNLPPNMHIDGGKLLKCPSSTYVKPYNIKHNQTLPWVMYYDFESILVPVKDSEFSDKHKHKLSSYCYNLVCRERPSFNKFKIYRGTDQNDAVIDKFFNDIKMF